MEVQERCKGVNYVRKFFPKVHYEDIWSDYDACKSIVQEEWNTYGNPMLKFKKSAKNSMARLKWWSNHEFWGRDKELERLMKQLKRG